MTTRTVLIGLDGATFTILDPLMQDGVMPFLRGFVDTGVRARLRSVIPPLTPPAFASMMTGRSPGRHGILDFFCKVSPDSPRIRFANAHDVHAETLWSIVSRHGLRTTVLNFPLTFPPPEINGDLVPGWMPWRQMRLGCRPQGLYDRLKALPGFNVRELAMDMGLEEKAIEGCHENEYEDWIALHIRRERQWFEITRSLVRENPSDLTAVLFDGVDRLQHLCWRFLDPAYLERLGSAEEERIRERCLDYFRQLDGLIAEVVNLAGPETTVVLASDHGFGAQTGTFFVNTWLEQHGYLAWADEKRPVESDSQVLGVGQVARHEYLLDWKRTKAYAPTPSSNGIHIVVAGRGSDNGVAEADYEQVRNQLIAGLGGVTDPQTGEPIVSRIWTREEIFDGPFMELAPDITLALRDSGQVSILASNIIYKSRSEPSGTHRPEGIFMARGPGLREGVRLPELSILDVAPTVLYSLDLPIPEDMEGRVPVDALAPAARPVQKAAPLEAEPAMSSRTPSGPELDEKAEEEILKRLRALGYVE